MASTTPNIGLTLPTGTEGWKRSVINGNFTILDTKIGAVGNTSLQSQINTLSSHIESRFTIPYDGTSTPTQKFENAPVGFSVVSVIQGKEGNPTSDGAWTIMQFKPDTYNQYGIQMAVQTNSTKLYLRRLYAGTWSGWTLIGGN